MDQSVLLCGFDQIDKDKSTPWERRHLAGSRQGWRRSQPQLRKYRNNCLYYRTLGDVLASSGFLFSVLRLAGLVVNWVQQRE